MEIRPASTNGIAEPAAKGITVRGTSATETALLESQLYRSSTSRTLANASVAPLEAPVVTAVGRVGRRSRRSIVHATLDDLRKRRENVSGSAGLEGRSRDRLEDRLAPLHAEGRHDGGSEGALRGCGQSLAHKSGAERGSHGGWWCSEEGRVVVVVVLL
jgi:hypothetical protein